MVSCYQHADRQATQRCAGCAEPFCASCLVEIGGNRYCESCKVLVPRSPLRTRTHLSSHAKTAAILACLSPIGFFLGPYGLLMCVIGIASGYKALCSGDELEAGWGLGLLAGLACLMTLIPLVVALFR